MTSYFEGCKNLDEVKEVYRNLAKKYHPDICQNKEIFKEINNQYDFAIDNLTDKTSEKKANSEKEEANLFKDIINELNKFDDIDIEICGWFLWISGNTKPIKETIKNLGFRWARKKQMWYHKPTWYYSKNRNEWDINTIRNTYGSIKIDKNKNAPTKMLKAN